MAQKTRSIKVCLASKNLRQFFFHIKEFPPRGMSGLELDHHVNITVGPEIGTQHRAKQSKLPNMVPAAEISDFVSVYGNSHAHLSILRLNEILP